MFFQRIQVMVGQRSPKRIDAGLRPGLGNAVLLGRDANRQLGSQCYSEKVSAYRARDWPTTRMADVAEWTPQAVEERQSHLAEQALKVWRIEML
jgi:hypothetical protein